MEVIELVEELQLICQRLREDGSRIGFVPTMGALHRGHAWLIKHAAGLEDEKKDGDNDYGCITGFKQSEENGNGKLLKHRGQRTKVEGFNLSTSLNAETRRKVVIVSIFVNRKQFNNATDFENYPKTVEADLKLCRQLNVDYVFMPSQSEMYHSELSQCMVSPPENLANDLEGKSRPGHFEGMLTVVCKLFNIIRPHEAYFGKKDYQQFILVARMVRDLNMNVELKPIETIRESDLLPLSSRNVRLDEKQRKVAPIMYKVLDDAKKAIEFASTHNDVMNSQRGDIGTIIMASMLSTLCLNLDDEYAQILKVDYLELRCSRDLSRVSLCNEIEAYDCQEGCVRRRIKRFGCTDKTLSTRLLTSVILDKVRLLDNIGVKLNLKSNS